MYKRVTSLLLIAAVLLCLAACGSEAERTDTPNDDIGDIASTLAPAATPSPEATGAPEETAEPSPSATPEPTPTVTPTPAPTPAPEVTPTPLPPPETPAESEEPAVTDEPEASEEPESSEQPENTESPEVSVEPGEEGEGVNLQDFYDTLSATYEFSSMMDMDTEMMDAYYPGLSSVSMSQYVGKIAMITASANEIVLIECASSDDVAAVQAILESRKQTQVDGGAWYPESITMWESAQICVNGNYLMLVSHANAADIAESFNALFSE